MRSVLALLLSVMSLSAAAGLKTRPPLAGQTAAARLLEVSFAGGRDIARDDGSGTYTAPHWRASAVEQHPYLIKAGETLRVANAKVQVLGTTTGTLMIRGIRKDALGVPPTAASRVAGTTDTYQITDVPLAAPFTANKIAFYNPFEIRWELSRDAGRGWEPAGVSSNPMYVCLTDAGMLAQPLLTIIHTACSR